MINILMAGVGGQGTVLAAKVLAQAAQDKGWQVRTGETIGMAQRGGSVVSHVRMGNAGEEVYSSLVAKGDADLIIAFEPAEAVRVLPYLSETGMLVSATTGIPSVSTTLSGKPYEPEKALGYLRGALESRFLPVDDKSLCEKAGTRKVLNMILLAIALDKIDEGTIPLNWNDLKKAVETCVKKQFVELNLKAIDLA